MKNKRHDDSLDAAVNRGIAAILMTGIHAGIEVMKENKVPLHIVARVVLGPNSRRSTDWKH